MSAVDFFLKGVSCIRFRKNQAGAFLNTLEVLSGSALFGKSPRSRHEFFRFINLFSPMSVRSLMWAVSIISVVSIKFMTFTAAFESWGV